MQVSCFWNKDLERKIADRARCVFLGMSIEVEMVGSLNTPVPLEYVLHILPRSKKPECPKLEPCCQWDESHYDMVGVRAALGNFCQILRLNTYPVSGLKCM